MSNKVRAVLRLIIVFVLGLVLNILLDWLTPLGKTIFSQSLIGDIHYSIFAVFVFMFLLLSYPSPVRFSDLVK